MSRPSRSPSSFFPPIWSGTLFLAAKVFLPSPLPQTTWREHSKWPKWRSYPRECPPSGRSLGRSGNLVPRQSHTFYKRSNSRPGDRSGWVHHPIGSFVVGWMGSKSCYALSSTVGGTMRRRKHTLNTWMRGMFSMDFHSFSMYASLEMIKRGLSSWTGMDEDRSGRTKLASPMICEVGSAKRHRTIWLPKSFRAASVLFWRRNAMSHLDTFQRQWTSCGVSLKLCSYPYQKNTRQWPWGNPVKHSTGIQHNLGFKLLFHCREWESKECFLVFAVKRMLQSNSVDTVGFKWRCVYEWLLKSVKRPYISFSWRMNDHIFRSVSSKSPFLGKLVNLVLSSGCSWRSLVNSCMPRSVSDAARVARVQDPAYTSLVSRQWPRTSSSGQLLERPRHWPHGRMTLYHTYHGIGIVQLKRGP